jgi:putative acetyltransferase
MSAVVVRTVTAEDVPNVAALVRGVLAEFGIAFGVGSETDAQVLALPASYEAAGGRFWVATDDGALLGTCGVFPLGSGDWELRKMYLDAAARGRGVGRRLLDEAEAFTRAAGGRRLVLDTTEQMTRAIAFYEANGFVRDDAQARGSRCSRGYARTL